MMVGLLLQGKKEKVVAAKEEEEEAAVRTIEDQRSVAAKVVAVRTEHQRSVVAEVAVVVVTLTKRKDLKVVRRNEVHVPSGTYLCIVQINLQFDEQK